MIAPGMALVKCQEAVDATEAFRHLTAPRLVVQLQCQSMWDVTQRNFMSVGAKVCASLESASAMLATPDLRVTEKLVPETARAMVDACEVHADAS